MEDLNMLALYNHKVKEQFLKEFIGSNNSKRTFYYTLKKTAYSEKLIGKDLYEMTVDEVKDVLQISRRTTKSSVMAFISNISTYINWAIENGYRTSNLPMFTAESISANADDFVCKTLSAYYTQDELIKYYNRIMNKSDVLILQCIFEGIKGQSYSEMFNLKEKDLYKENGKFYVNLYDTEKGTERLGHEISEFLYNLMLDVSEYTTIYDIRNKKLELIPSQYILKKTSKGNRDQNYEGKLTYSYLINKTKYFKEDIFKNDAFKYREIEKSGIMHYLNKLLTDNNKRVAGNEEYKAISDKFNVGKYRHKFYQEEVVNYTAIKGLIDIDFYEEHYGEIELT